MCSLFFSQYTNHGHPPPLLLPHSPPVTSFQPSSTSADGSGFNNSSRVW